MRKATAFALVAVMLVFAWFVYTKVSDKRREAAYTTKVAKFQRDLPLGTSRLEIGKYLDSRNIEYREVHKSVTPTYEIKIDETAGGLFCASWNIYIDFEFTSSDTLREIHTRGDGRCL